WFPCTSPFMDCISAGWAGKYSLKKVLKFFSPIKHIPVLSFFVAVARLFSSAILRTSFLSRSPSGNNTFSKTSGLILCKKYVLYFLLCFLLYNNFFSSFFTFL